MPTVMSSYTFEEGAGEIVFDRVGTNHGYTAGAVFGDQDLKSYKNEEGYSTAIYGNGSTTEITGLTTSYDLSAFTITLKGYSNIDYTTGSADDVLFTVKTSESYPFVFGLSANYNGFFIGFSNDLYQPDSDVTTDFSYKEIDIEISYDGSDWSITQNNVSYTLESSLASVTSDNVNSIFGVVASSSFTNSGFVGCLEELAVSDSWVAYSTIDSGFTTKTDTITIYIPKRYNVSNIDALGNSLENRGKVHYDGLADDSGLDGQRVFYSTDITYVNVNKDNAPALVQADFAEDAEYNFYDLFNAVDYENVFADISVDGEIKNFIVYADDVNDSRLPAIGRFIKDNLYFFGNSVQWFTPEFEEIDGEYKVIDNKGYESRTVQPARCYLGDGTAYIAVTGILATDTYTATLGTVTISDGRIDIASAVSVADIIIYRSGVLWAWYKCDESDGSIAYDSSGNGNHGTITNATLSSFHAVDYANGSDYQNQVGYSDGTGALAGVLIPRDESDHNKDVLGNDLEYNGRVKYNADLVESNCGTFDGVDDYVDTNWQLTNLTNTMSFGAKFKISSLKNQCIYGYSDGSSAIILRLNADGTISFWADASYVSTQFITNIQVDIAYILLLTYDIGTQEASLYLNNQLISTNTYSVPYDKSGNLIIGQRGSSVDVFDGTMHDTRVWQKVLSEEERTQFFNGEQTGNEVISLPFSEGSGTTIYDVSGNGNHGTATNITESSFWGSTQDTFHYNLLNGFSERENLLTYSEDFSDSTWGIWRVSKTYNQITAPDGTLTADKITHIDGATGLPNVRKSNIVLNEGNYTFECYVKQGDVEAATLGIQKYSNYGIFMRFIFSSETLVFTQQGGSYECTGNYEDVGNGWYRLSLTSYFPANTYDETLVGLNKADGSDFGIDSGKYLYIWGAQLNTGSEALTYTPTTSTALELTKVPALEDGSTDALGLTTLNPAGNWHNNAETKIKQSQAKELISADYGNYWFDGSYNANTKGYDDLLTSRAGSINDQIFADVSTDNKTKTIATYREAQTGYRLTKIEEYTNQE